MTRGAASIPLGMVRSVRKPDTRRGHVKYAGLQLSTIRKYNLAIKRFFVWLDSAEKNVPVSLEELDEAVGGYINHLYQDDLPVGWASDVVCGFKRFYPKCRKSLQISAGYLRNWNECVQDTGSSVDFRHLDVIGGCFTPKGRNSFSFGFPVWFYMPVTHRGNCVFDT